LFWQIHSSRRGERQTAYRIMVASDLRLLRQGKADLWDSGKVLSDQSVQIEYGGVARVSRQECFWRVMAWDKDGRPTGWSDTASWTMGLLSGEEWQAQWIGDAVLADPANRPLRPIHCYRSHLANDPHAGKWIVLDLGAVRTVDSVDIIPARPQGLHSDFRTVVSTALQGGDRVPARLLRCAHGCGLDGQGLCGSADSQLPVCVRTG
jgi:alpha-L-rhamnosidase